MTVAVDRATNRVAGKAHDQLGNLLEALDPDGGPMALTYWDQGHVRSVSRVVNGQNKTWRYYYDAEGKRRITAPRVSGVDPNNVTLSFYDGEYLMCEQDRGSRLQDGDAYATKLLLTDHLGTTRAELVYNNAADAPRVKRVYDTMPYGQLIPRPSDQSPANPEKVLFTGKQRDSESGMDFFGARYSMQAGRFISVDYFMNDTGIEDPRSWNLYAYCRCNPLTYLDPTGEKICVGGLGIDERIKLEGQLNELYGASCVSTDRDGYLKVDTNVVATLPSDVQQSLAFLTEAINGDSYFATVESSNHDPNVSFGVNMGKTGRINYNGKAHAADRIVLDFSDENNLAGDSFCARIWLDTVFAHEIAHGILLKKDDEYCGTGPIVDKINEVQLARGWYLRAGYKGDVRFGRKTTGAQMFVQYGIPKTNNGNIVRKSTGGIEIDPQSDKVVHWLVISVGGR